MVFPLRDAVEPLTAFASEAGLWQPEAGFLRVPVKPWHGWEG